MSNKLNKNLYNTDPHRTIFNYGAVYTRKDIDDQSIPYRIHVSNTGITTKELWGYYVNPYPKSKPDPFSELGWKIHREGDKPAHIVYYASGCVSTHMWYINGLLHRLRNPAFIQYNKSARIENSKWFMHGNPQELISKIVKDNKFKVPLNNTDYETVMIIARLNGDF